MLKGYLSFLYISDRLVSEILTIQNPNIFRLLSCMTNKLVKRSHLTGKSANIWAVFMKN